MKRCRCSSSLWIAAGLAATVGFGGCFDLAMRQELSTTTAVQWTSSDVRAARRAYDGAPPVIPHAPQSAACITCHTSEGKELPDMGRAPASPHAGSERAGSLHNCRQCHLFIHDEQLFAENDFQGMAQRLAAGERAHALAPPVIPHGLLMRENCLACHSGPAARPEIRCTHPERTNCRQCHLHSETSAVAFNAPAE